MWKSKDITILISISSIACVTTENCDPINNLPSWNSHGFEPPAYLRLGPVPEIEAALEAQVENVRENFTLTLFAKPFIVNGNDCPSAIKSYHDLRKFHKSRRIVMTDSVKQQSIFFGNIFTGCYYVEMTNEEGRKWLWDPVFLNTSYRYHDTMLKCKNVEVRSGNHQLSSQLRVELEIPLNCLKIRCQLFERSKIPQAIIDNLISGNVPASQDCWVKNIGNGNLPEVSCGKRDTKLTINTTLVSETGEEAKGWSTVITWDLSEDDDAFYYASFESFNHNCSWSYADLMTWRPVVDFYGISHGFLKDSKTECIWRY